MLKELVDIAKSIVIAFVAAFIIITFVFQTVTVDGSSMNPTLKSSDRLIVEKVTYYFRKPKPGDIVVIKYPADTRQKFIKRVMAVGGDKVAVVDGHLYINGELKEESYTLEERMMSDFNEVTVPKNTVFVMGDNRNNSKDSREQDVGFVSYKLVVGRASLRIYPFNAVGKL